MGERRDEAKANPARIEAQRRTERRAKLEDACPRADALLIDTLVVAHIMNGGRDNASDG